MSYKQAMNWRKKHPKGTKQPVLMHTNSGFWPSGAWLKSTYWPYLERCEKEGIEPKSCESVYRSEI